MNQDTSEPDSQHSLNHPNRTSLTSVVFFGAHIILALTVIGSLIWNLNIDTGIPDREFSAPGSLIPFLLCAVLLSYAYYLNSQDDSIPIHSKSLQIVGCVLTGLIGTMLAYIAYVVVYNLF